MKLAWGARVADAFRWKVLAIASALRVDPSWLMAVMAFESRLDPTAVNASTGASGLIQFMPDTARGLGTTVEAIRQLGALEQLDLVARYFAPFVGRLASLSDCYMAVLWPEAVGHGDEEVIFPGGTRAFLLNRGLDLDHDNAVTKGEAASFVAKTLATGMEAGNVFVFETGGEQAPAPIEELSTQLQPKGDTMGVAIPLLLQLVPQILQLFSARAQTQISKATGADPTMAAQFMQNLIAQVGQVAGVPVVDNATAVQAVAKVTALPDPARAAAAAELEAHSLDYLDKLSPLLDKIAVQEKALWAARDASADLAGERGRKDKVDIAPQLVRNGTLDFRGAMLGIMVLLGVQMYFADDHRPDPTLTGFLGLFAYGVIRLMDRPSAYRFGGAFETSTTIDTSKSIVDQALGERRSSQSRLNAPTS